MYEKLPHDLGYDTAPVWWPLPWLALAGLLTAFAIVRLPGHGGHVPAEGLKTGGRRSVRSICRACCWRRSRRSASGLCWGRRGR